MEKKNTCKASFKAKRKHGEVFFGQPSYHLDGKIKGFIDF